MKRPAYSIKELKGMTPDQITGIAGPTLCEKVMQQTVKQFQSNLKRRDGESQGEFLQRQRSASATDSKEFPRAARANLEGAIFNSEANRQQAKMDKMFAGMKSTPEEKATLAANAEARALRDRQREWESGRTFTAGPAPLPAAWDGHAAKPARAPASQNPTRPTPPRAKGKK